MGVGEKTILNITVSIKGVVTISGIAINEIGVKHGFSHNDGEVNTFGIANKPDANKKMPTPNTCE